jgi:hypothetical protein
MNFLINFFTIMAWIGVVISLGWIVRQLIYTGHAAQTMSRSKATAVSNRYSIKKPLILLIICVVFLIAKAIS